MEIGFDFLKSLGELPAIPDDSVEYESDEYGDLHVVLTEPQSQFLQLTCRNPLFIGGYGSGKTYIKLISAFSDVTQFPKANIGLYDPTYDLIGLNTAPRFEEMLIQMDMPYKYDKSKNIISIEDHGKIIFRSMNNPERIVGYEVFRSHVDEIGVVLARRVEDVWNKIVARNRQKIPVLDENARKVIDIKTRKPLLEQNRISAYGTPDDGYGFTYQKWGKNPAAGYEYVRAPTSSNLENIPDDYIDSLRRIYPAALVDAFLDGYWTNFTTGSVYYAFDRDKNNTKYTAVKGEHLHIGMDFNVYNMAAVVCVRRAGKLYVVDEFIGFRDTPDIVTAIKATYPENSVTVYPDATSDNKSSKGANLSDISILKKAGFAIKIRTKNPFVRDRIFSVNSAFERQDVFVNVERAPQTAESLEQQVYGPNGEPDKKHGHDHPNDALGYIVSWIYPVRRPDIRSLGVRNL